MSVNGPSRGAFVGGTGGVDDAGGGADAASAGTDAGAGAGGAARARPRSLDMGGLSLAGDLQAKLDAASAEAAFTSQPPTLADVASKFATLPREGRHYDAEFETCKSMLEGRVTTKETEQMLLKLAILPSPQWLATMDKLRATPSDERGLSLLDKLVKYGVNDRNRFIAEFADQINDKLGFGNKSLFDRRRELEDDGMSYRKAARTAGREVRAESEVLLDFFNAKDRQGFVNSLRAAGEATGNALSLPGQVLLALMGVHWKG